MTSFFFRMMKKEYSKIIRFAVYFVVSLLVLQVITHLPYIREPFSYLTTQTTSFILQLFDNTISVYQCHIIGSIDMEIIYECTGIYGVIILLSGFIASWFPWEEKLIACLWGTIAIFLVNQLRLVSIFLIASKWPSSFELLHTYFWQVFLILFVCLFYYLWFRNMSEKYEKKQSSSKEH